MKNLQNKLIIFFCLIFFVTLFRGTSAKANDHDFRRGLAVVTLKNSKITLELTQLISVTAKEVSFVNIDDFGQESFEIIFDRKKMHIKTQNNSHSLSSPMRKALRIPLTAEEFLAIMNYDKPEKFKQSEDIESVSWQKPGYKKMKILFSGFNSQVRESQPDVVRVEYKRNFLQIKWINSKLPSKRF